MDSEGGVEGVELGRLQKEDLNSELKIDKKNNKKSKSAKGKLKIDVAFLFRVDFRIQFLMWKLLGCVNFSSHFFDLMLLFSYFQEKRRALL